jgi:hypothetical protein
MLDYGARTASNLWFIQTLLKSEHQEDHLGDERGDRDIQCITVIEI